MPATELPANVQATGLSVVAMLDALGARTRDMDTAKGLVRAMSEVIGKTMDSLRSGLSGGTGVRRHSRVRRLHSAHLRAR
jgi:hypothetical protein